MTRSSHLNKLIFFFSVLFFLLIISSNKAISAVDIWEKKENNLQTDQLKDENEITIESPILSDDINKITINIDEQKLDKSEQTLVGLFDPEENNFNLNMWSESDGEEIKKILKRINKLQLSKASEDLLFQILFTNAHAPKKNLTSDDFTKIKIDWLIKKKRIDDLEKLLSSNPEIGKRPKAIKFLVDEYLSNADIKSACKKTEALEKSIENNYLEKFKIYCLINDNRKEEAQLVYDLLKERGFKDKFFDNKINFLLGITSETNQKTLDDNLLNFYLSHITSENFLYEPSDKTDKYIWKYLSSSNLIKVKDFENEDVIITYEQAAVEGSFEKEEIFNIYLRIYFSFNQLINAAEIYKNLPNYKARALIYQSVLLSDNIEKKLDLAFLLKDLFLKDKLFSIYSEELSRILNKIDPNQLPEDYVELVDRYLQFGENYAKKIKFDNDILHRSKVIKHFINDNEISKTEKDFKSVYKKIKKNKKYFISIKDIVVLESLAADGINIPTDIDFKTLSSELSIPQNLNDLATKNQVGLLMLKIVEIIGEDNIKDLDSETIYFLTKILNQLNLKKIRNNILSEALPVRV